LPDQKNFWLNVCAWLCSGYTQILLGVEVSNFNQLALIYFCFSLFVPPFDLNLLSPIRKPEPTTKEGEMPSE
jgi:hypothetical protein